MAQIRATSHPGLKFAKGRTRKQAKAKRTRVVSANTKAVRSYVFKRERETCRCCGLRRAESMHEMKSAGAMGSRLKATTKANSVAVCGSGTTLCHGYLQRYSIQAAGSAEGVLLFTPTTKAAAEHMGLAIGDIRRSGVRPA